MPLRARSAVLANALAVACLLSAETGCGGGGSLSASPTPAPFAVTLGAETPVLTEAQRTAFGFAFGPPDGTVGVLTGSGGDQFFMAARSGAACAGTPGVQGTYRLGGSLSAFTEAYGCSAVLEQGTPDPNGYTFDRDYAGGGPVLPIASGANAAILHVYHGEYHQACGTQTCFYASLGLALSKDGGASFAKLGEIIQPEVPRETILSQGENFDVGGGSFVLADANGNFISETAAANAGNAYVYVFYMDEDPSLAAPCNTRGCIAVARAKLSAVEAAALSGNTAVAPRLFEKYYDGGFTQPATSGDPNAATASGHFTPVVADVGDFPTVIYDRATNGYVMAYDQGNDSIVMRRGRSPFVWSPVIAAGSFSNAPDAELYATLVGGTADPTTSDGAATMIYVKGTAPWPDWPAATVYERSVTFGR